MRLAPGGPLDYGAWLTRMKTVGWKNGYFHVVYWVLFFMISILYCLSAFTPLNSFLFFSPLAPMIVAFGIIPLLTLFLTMTLFEMIFVKELNQKGYDMGFLDRLKLYRAIGFKAGNLPSSDEVTCIPKMDPTSVSDLVHLTRLKEKSRPEM